MHRRPRHELASAVAAAAPYPETPGSRETSPELPWIEFGEHLRINLPSAGHALALVDERLARGRGFALATLNLDHAVQLAEPGPFRDAYARHSHVTADGHPVAWLARRLDPRVRRVTGADLVLPCVGVAARRRAPVALVGATPEVLDRAAVVLCRHFPELRIALALSPSYPFDPSGPEADAAIAAIRASGARLVLLALGAPRQEILAVRLAAAAPEIGVLSVGAGIDFVAGAVRRAPRFFQRTGLEWLWRLAREPVRLGPRYWRCIKILPRLVTEAARRAD